MTNKEEVITMTKYDDPEMVSAYEKKFGENVTGGYKHD